MTPEQITATLQKYRGAFTQALPRGVEAQQIIRDVMTCARKTPDLLLCTEESVLGAAMTCAQLGLRPGVLGQAWILPFWDYRERRKVATFVAGYQGLVQLAYRHPAVTLVQSRMIYQADEWSEAYGSDPKLIHVPNRQTPTRGPMVAAYTVHRTANGGGAFTLMTSEELAQHRDRYARRNQQGQIVGPWGADRGTNERDWMELKTTLRQHYRWMPASLELESALAADGGVRVSVEPSERPEDATDLPALTAQREALTAGAPEDEPPPDVDSGGYPLDVDPTADRD